MNQCPEHLDAIARELTNLNHQVQAQKEKLELIKQEYANFQNQAQQLSSEIHTSTIEVSKNNKIIERLQTLCQQYMPLATPENQMKLQTEMENARQQPPVAAMMTMMPGVPPHMQAMMMAQAQAQQAAQAQAQQAAQAAASRGQMIPGINSPASRMAKQNGMTNGAVPGMPSGMQNGMGLAAMNQMSQMMGMTNIAQLQALAAYSQMGAAMSGIPGMPTFNPAQMAAMQSMGMMPPMNVPGVNPSMAQPMPPHMNLSINTPSRNTNSNGPVSGNRTPQSVASPRQMKTEGASTPVVGSDEKRISPSGDDTVAVA